MIKSKTYVVEVNTLSKRVIKFIHTIGKPIVINNKDNIVSTLVYTDGVIVKNNTKSYARRSYVYKDEEITGDLILDVSEIVIENPTYILEVTLKKSWLDNDHVEGYFDVIDDTSIYLVNKGDKEALKKAKATINHLRTDYNDVYSLIDLIKYKDDTYNCYYKIDKNVYSLKKLL